MNLVYLAATQIPSRVASSVHVMKMCQGFRRNGHEVTLLIPGRGETPPSDESVFSRYGIDIPFVIERLSPWWFGYGFAWRAALRAKSLRPDLVYSRYLPGGFTTGYLGLPFVYETHEEANRLSPAWRWMFSRLLQNQNLKRLVVISRPLIDYYTSTHNVKESFIYLAPDAADDPSPLPPGFALTPAGQLTVVYVGHLYPGRGMDLIVALATRCPWAAFHIVGGSPEDIQYWADRTREQDNIIMHGFVAPVETDKYRLAADVLIAPYQERVTVRGKGDTSKWMSPLKIFEYMAAGKAIITSDIPVLHEPLTAGETALFCPVDDVESWAEALQRLRDDPPLRQQLGQNARRAFLEKHTWAMRAKNVLSELSFS